MLYRSNRRTVADIRSKIAERSKKGVIPRTFHAKNDSQAIASWRLDLDRILLVFNVGSVVSAWSALTVPAPRQNLD